MKTLKKILLLLCLPVVMGGMLFFQSCRDEEYNPADFLDDSTWELESVKLDGVDVTANFSGLELVLEYTSNKSTRNYKCNNAKAPIWPSFGIFHFSIGPHLGSFAESPYHSPDYPYYNVEILFRRGKGDAG